MLQLVYRLRPFHALHCSERTVFMHHFCQHFQYSMIATKDLDCRGNRGVIFPLRDCGSE